MAARKVVLRMVDGGGCPLLDAGDRMVLEGDEVVKRSSGRICARALCCILPQLGGETPFGAEFSCSGPGGCTARFVAEESPAEDEAGARRLRRDAAASSDETPFLSRLPVELVRDLIARCEILRYGDTSVVIREGEVGKAVFFVGDGTVEVVKEGESSDVVLATLAKGTCFGEMSLLTGEPTSATVRTNGPAAVFSLAGDELERMLGEFPELAREFSKLLAARLKTTSGSLERELDRGILGRLSMISAVDLIQTLNASRRTGTLTLTLGGQQCRLYFRQGEAVGAVMGDTAGEGAFFELLSWPDGDFCFEQAEEGELGEVPGPLRSSTTALLMEGLRRIDESTLGGGAGGSADEVMGEALG